MNEDTGAAYNVTPNQAAKLFVYQWGADASNRWKHEYSNYSSLNETIINQIDSYIDKHINRVGKFLARRNKGSNEQSDIKKAG